MGECKSVKELMWSSGVLKIVGGMISTMEDSLISSHEDLKWMEHVLFLWGVTDLVPLILPCCRISNDVGTDGGKVSCTLGGVMLTTMDVVIIVAAVVEGITVSTLAICTLHLFFL